MRQYVNFCDYFADKYQITYNTINLKENYYNNTFVELTNIESGGFGTVHQIQNKNDDKIYAIKIQDLNGISNSKI